MAALSEGGFSGGALTGAVTSVSDDLPAQHRQMPLISIAILLITISFVLSLLIARRVRKVSRYRN